jgi:hypothetical protein
MRRPVKIGGIYLGYWILAACFVAIVVTAGWWALLVIPAAVLAGGAHAWSLTGRNR